MIRVLAPAPVVLPLLAAAMSLVLRRYPRVQRLLSVTVLGVVLAVSVALLLIADADGAVATPIGGWPVPQAIVLVVDRLSALMLVVATTVGLGVLLFAVGQGIADDERAREGSPVSIFHPTFLVLMAGVAFAFLAGDLFNLYVGFEVLLTASYVLLTLGGSAPRIRGGITYIVVSLMGSLLFLAAIALVYAATGTVNMAQLAGRLGDVPDGTRLTVHALLLVAFGLKAAVFPLSGWLPDSYPTAPAPVTAVFAGLLTKVGVYAIIRTQTLLFPGGAFDTLLMWVALATMSIGILGAVAQVDLRRMLSFTLVSHIGYMVFGIALGTVAGLAGAVFYVVHHIVIQATLFLVAGLVERRGGTTAVSGLGGLAASAPLLAVLYLVPALNLAGIPPLSGFLGKLGLLQAGVAAGGVLPAVLVGAGILTSLLTLVAVSRVWSRAFWRPAATDGGGPAADDEAGTGTDAEELRDGAPDDGDGEPDPRHAADVPGPTASGSHAGRTRQDVRAAAWRRREALATADDGGDDIRAENLRITGPLVGATAGMVAVSVALTGLAGPLYALTDRAAADLLERTPYVEAVYGEGPASSAEDVP